MISSQNMDWKNTLIWWIRIPLSWRIHRLIRDRWTTGGWSWCPSHFWTRIRACRRRFWGKWVRISSAGGGFSNSKMIRNSWRNRTNASRQHELVPFVQLCSLHSVCWFRAAPCRLSQQRCLKGIFQRVQIRTRPIRHGRLRQGRAFFIYGNIVLIFTKPEYIIETWQKMLSSLYKSKIMKKWHENVIKKINTLKMPPLIRISCSAATSNSSTIITMTIKYIQS